MSSYSCSYMVYLINCKNIYRHRTRGSSRHTSDSNCLLPLSKLFNLRCVRDKGGSGRLLSLRLTNPRSIVSSGFNYANEPTRRHVLSFNAPSDFLVCVTGSSNSSRKIIYTEKKILNNIKCKFTFFLHTGKICVCVWKKA